MGEAVRASPASVPEIAALPGPHGRRRRLASLPGAARGLDWHGARAANLHQRFYAVASTTVGGELAVAARGGADLVDPILISPSPNLLASFPGDRVHAVRPLYAGKRLSVVINFY